MGKRREKSKEQAERPNKRRRIIYSSEEEENHEDVNLSNEPRGRSCVASSSRTRSRSPVFAVHRDDSSRRRQPSPCSRLPSPCSRQPSPCSRQPSPCSRQSSLERAPSLQRDTQPEPGPSTVPIENCTEELELDEDILLLLGEAPKDVTPLGPPIHKDIASRWQEILANGLPKEVKEKIMKEHSIPSNCDLLIAPELNPEAKAALTEIFVKRDTSLMNKQKQIAVALSALATVTQLIVSNETSKQKLLKPLSDACRIMCDAHYKETTTRRNFVVSSINTTLKDTLIEAKRGKFLFGDNVGEKLKIAQSIQRSGDVLKKQQQKNVFTKNNFTLKKGRLNYQQNQRKTNHKPAGDPPRAARPTSQRQPPRHAATSSTRKPSDRSPPRRTYQR